MSAVRTLPIRVPRSPGEAIDSWLEAIAHRTHTALGDLLTAVGAHPYPVRQLAPIGGSCNCIPTRPQRSHGDRSRRRHDPRDDAVPLRGQGSTHRYRDTGTSPRFPVGPCASVHVSAQHAWPRRVVAGNWRGAWAGRSPAPNTTVCSPTPAHRAGGYNGAAPHVGDAIPHPATARNPAPDATGRAPARCAADLTAAPVASFTTITRCWWPSASSST